MVRGLWAPHASRAFWRVPAHGGALPEAAGQVFLGRTRGAAAMEQPLRKGRAAENPKWHPFLPRQRPGPPRTPCMGAADCLVVWSLAPPPSVPHPQSSQGMGCPAPSMPPGPHTDPTKQVPEETCRMKGPHTPLSRASARGPTAFLEELLPPQSPPAVGLTAGAPWQVGSQLSRCLVESSPTEKVPSRGRRI